MTKTKVYKCTFCDKKADEVQNLFAHQTKREIGICDECVILCHDQLRDRLYETIDELTEKLHKLLNIIGEADEKQKTKTV